MIVIGLIIKHYIKWVKLNDINRILGLGVYWLMFYSNMLLLFGIIAFSMLGISLILELVIKVI